MAEEAAPQEGSSADADLQTHSMEGVQHRKPSQQDADLQTWLLLAQSAAEALRKRRRNVRAVGTVSSKLSAPQMSSSMRRISRLVYVLSVM